MKKELKRGVTTSRNLKSNHYDYTSEAWRFFESVTYSPMQDPVTKLVTYIKNKGKTFVKPETLAKRREKFESNLR